MKTLNYIVLTIALALAGCGSVKTTVKSDTQVNAVAKTKADSSSDKISDTKTFGDTLRQTSFVPAGVLTDTPSAAAKDTVPYAITSESDGIEFKETFTPAYDQGHFIGDQTSVVAIAKPVTTTNTREVQHSNVSTTSTKDSITLVQTSVKKTIGWGLPSWVWWIAGILVVGAVVYFVKPLLKLA